MPVVTIQLWEGRTIEQKRALVKGITWFADGPEEMRRSAAWSRP